MTTLNIATDIPSQITTVEQLAAWCAGILFAVNPTTVASEGVGYSERVAQKGIFWVAAASQHREIVRLSFEVSPDHLAGGAKPWTYIQPLSNSAIPAAFKAN